jgi:hypothetical protein
MQTPENIGLQENGLRRIEREVYPGYTYFLGGKWGTRYG